MVVGGCRAIVGGGSVMVTWQGEGSGGCCLAALVMW